MQNKVLCSMLLINFIVGFSHSYAQDTNPITYELKEKLLFLCVMFKKIDN